MVVMNKLARSKAGHDKGKVYVVVSETETELYLADGDLKKLAAPKKKNRRHAQVIYHLPEEILSLTEKGRGGQ